jgi:hypothetical protein
MVRLVAASLLASFGLLPQSTTPQGSAAARVINLTCEEGGSPRPFAAVVQDLLAVLKKSGQTARYDVWRGAAGPYATCVISQHPSHREWIKDGSLTALPGSTGSHWRSIVATLREDLSFHPQGMVGGAAAYSVNLVHTHPGHAADYVAERRIVRNAHEAAATKESYSVYQVTAGMPSGTFMVMIPYSTLGELDDVAAIHGRAYDQALGDEGRQKSRDLTISGTRSAETLLFTVIRVK